jgi:hypothetical protein
MMDSRDVEKLLKKAYASIDGFEIKSRVDELGIEEFIARCAKLGAGTGFAAGSAGAVTLAPFLVLDVANYLYQQVRITMGVIYHRTGRYRVGFDEMVVIMAVALGVRIAGVAALYAGHALIVSIGKEELVKLVIKQLMKRLPTSAASKVVPGIGGLIGAGFNYVSLQSYGQALLKVDTAIFADPPRPPDATAPAEIIT